MMTRSVGAARHTAVAHRVFGPIFVPIVEHGAGRRGDGRFAATGALLL